MRLSRPVLSGCFTAALLWAVGCGVDGSLTFVPDDTFNGSGKAGAAGAGGGAAGTGGGAAGTGGGAAGQGQGGQPAGGSAGQVAGGAAGSGGKAMFDPKCAGCLTSQCPALLSQCVDNNTCVECVLNPGGGDCAQVPLAVALHGCACSSCDKQCDKLKCGGTGGAAGGGGAGPGGKAGAGGFGPGGKAGGPPGGMGGIGPGGAGGAPLGCGNGVIDGNEECDGALPLSQKTCAEYLGDPSAHGKIFCTSGCTVDANDCHACGDGTANHDEECDSTDLKGKTCEALQQPVGTLGCSPLCKFDLSKCNGVAPVCGDGVLLPEVEDCDGVELGGADCEWVLGAAYEGKLGCNAQCRFDTQQCKRRAGMREGPTMVPVPRMDGNGDFLIDSTEVTRAQYDYFLRHLQGGGIGLPPFCGYQGTSVADFTPTQACLSAAPVDGTGAGARAHSPAVCVDMCDALAYCQWAGKSICGGMAQNPPNAPWDKLNDSNINAWTSACTANGAAVYPYGDTYQQGLCSDDGLGAQEVGTRDGCHSPKPGYDALRDMSGNVGEWTDACKPSSPFDLCAVRGGGHDSTPDELRCVSNELRPRNTQSGSIGFRCCEVTGNPPPP